MMPRGFPRLRIASDADIQLQDRVVHGTLQNISMSGMFIKAPVPLKVGDASRVIIHLPVGAIQKDMEINGVIVRIDPEGVALQFRNIDFETFGHLRAIFQNKSMLNRLAS
jgi:hypothetical protein